jgi:hypothetical protein
MLPKDPAILLSYINTKLRDFYPTLDALCADTGAERGEVENALSEIGYAYDEKLNRFI